MPEICGRILLAQIIHMKHKLDIKLNFQKKAIFYFCISKILSSNNFTLASMVLRLMRYKKLKLCNSWPCVHRLTHKFIFKTHCQITSINIIRSRRIKSKNKTLRTLVSYLSSQYYIKFCKIT